MRTVDLDRQQIERRDFPIVRRGYDPATVDAHLRALAGEIEDLAGRANSGTGESLAAVAGSQVQGILEAAQATAETIEREAAQDARSMRAAATEDARRTRDDAIAKAQDHVAAVSQATDALLARVGSMDSETQTLIESLRSGATRLTGDLTTVEVNMEGLYDAAAGRGTGASGAAPGGAPIGAPHVGAVPAQAAVAPVEHRNGIVGPSLAASAEPLIAHTEEPHVEAPVDPQVEEPWEPPSAFSEEVPEHEETPAEAGGDDLDGPRLVALNMALNGDSREVTGRYIDENFQVADRERLLDEVYAAIEG
jgi:hypothetical protein